MCEKGSVSGRINKGLGCQEAENQIKRRKKGAVLILVNHEVVIYNFRLELVERLLMDGYEVHISVPFGERVKDLKALGAVCHDIKIDRHGMNPKDEIHILAEYRHLIRTIYPIAVLSYTVKPNVYGGIVAGAAHIPFIPNITGLGMTVHGGGVKEALVLLLYKFSLRRAQKVFFQNEANKNFMAERNIVSGPYTVLPGSGVNLNMHCFEPYPENTDELIFITVGRIMKDKGTDELLEAAKAVKKCYPKVRFQFIGFFDDDYERKMNEAVNQGLAEYMGQQQDIHSYMKAAHAIIHPSHHEGMSNVLLEAAAAGRPVLASNIPGCQEAFDEKVSGLGFEAQNTQDLIRVIKEFIRIPYEKKVIMGKKGREKMEKEFDRQIVVEKYMNAIKRIGEKQEAHGIV